LAAHHTHGSAFALGVAHGVGTISTGKQADLVVLSQSPIDADPEHIDEIEVLRTYLAGRIAYARS
jgi:predicted amidohydrolase YtcJ